MPAEPAIRIALTRADRAEAHQHDPDRPRLTVCGRRIRPATMTEAHFAAPNCPACDPFTRTLLHRALLDLAESDADCGTRKPRRRKSRTDLTRHAYRPTRAPADAGKEPR